MMPQNRMTSESAPFSAILLFLGGSAAIYFGCRGFQSRGIVVWHRSGSETRLAGWPGRILGALLVAAGGWFIWGGLGMAMQR